MHERVDFHTHSHFSDGTLAPGELVALAGARGVAVLALTDHDTVAGCAEAGAACASAGIRFVAGAELTVSWQGRELHVLALAADPTSPVLLGHLAGVVARRRRRIAAIGERLASARDLQGTDVAAEVLAGGAVPTRTHLARALVRAGHATNLQQAFERWLRRGRPGHVPAEWPSLPDSIEAIRASGGIAVLAHPHRYGLSGGPLRALVAEFAAAGGGALEVSLAGMSDADAARLASLARRHGLAGSIGSDFHEPGLPWRPVGRFAKLPDCVEPILARLAPA